LEQILEAARWAPTAHNMQNSFVLSVDEPELLQRIGKLKSRISEIFLKENYEQFSFSKRDLQEKGTGVLATMFPSDWQHPTEFHKIALGSARPLSESLQGSPIVLLVLYDPQKRAPASTGDFLGIISLGCVMENIWLAAQSLAISAQVLSLFVGRAVEKEIRQILGIPKPLKIAYAIRLGFPVRKQSTNHFRVRGKAEDIVYKNNWERVSLNKRKEQV
jgi:nitroreductase